MIRQLRIESRSRGPPSARPAGRCARSSALAGPIAAAMAGETVMGLVDTKLVGGLGPAALGGVGVAMTIAFLGYMAIFGLMRGVKVCVAHAVGEGLGHRSVRYAQAGIALGARPPARPCGPCTRDVGAALPRAIRIDAGARALRERFPRRRSPSARPASAVVSALTQHRQALGRRAHADDRRARAATSSTRCSAGRSSTGTRAFRRSASGAARWPRPRPSVVEAHRSRRAARPARRRRSGTLRARSRRAALCAAPCARSPQLGVPTGLQFGSEMLAFATFTALLGTLGAEQIAAHQIALATHPHVVPARSGGRRGGERARGAGARAALARRRRPGDARRAAPGRVVHGRCGVVFAVAWRRHACAPSPTTRWWRASRADCCRSPRRFQVLDAVEHRPARRSARRARTCACPALIGVAVVWTCVPTAALAARAARRLGRRRRLVRLHRRDDPRRHPVRRALAERLVAASVCSA